jgi:hypothetical protein
MTVCIAAMANNGNGPDDDYIVTACDSMLSFGDGTLTADNLAQKRNFIARNWSVMISGDVSEASLVIDGIREHARASSGDDFWKKEFKSTDITDFAVCAYKKRLNQKIQNEVLTPYGLTLGQFDIQDKPDIRSRIDWLVAHDFDCTLLMVGFDRQNDDLPFWDSHIITIRPPGDIASHRIPGFWAIGSGADLALSSLAFSHQQAYSDLQDTIWNVCVAKFRAESAYGVGRETELRITCGCASGSSVQSNIELDQKVIEDARKCWRLKENAQRQSPKSVKDFVRSRWPEDE